MFTQYDYILQSLSFWYTSPHLPLRDMRDESQRHVDFDKVIDFYFKLFNTQYNLKINNFLREESDKEYEPKISLLVEVQSLLGP